METAKQWFIDRFNEATTWDGVTILIISGAVLVASPFAKYLALAGVVYGLWRILKKEQNL